MAYTFQHSRQAGYEKLQVSGAQGWHLLFASKLSMKDFFDIAGELHEIRTTEIAESFIFGDLCSNNCVIATITIPFTFGKHHG